MTSGQITACPMMRLRRVLPVSFSVCLDSWAVLAWLNGEPPGRILRDTLRWALGDTRAEESLSPILKRKDGPPRISINVVNLGEIFYILARRIGEEEASIRIEQIRSLPIDVLPADDRTVMSAARIKARHRVSYADAFAIASARSNEGILLTGDPEIITVPDLNLCYIGR
jgi:predicted nucleic acid-binding protein